jgi:hypothetical protein
VREGWAGPVASPAVDLLAQTRRGPTPSAASRHIRPADPWCRTGHRRRRRRFRVEWVLAFFGGITGGANGSSTDPSPKTVLTLPAPLAVRLRIRTVSSRGAAWLLGLGEAAESGPHCRTQQDPDVACPANVGLPRQVVRPMDRHPRLSAAASLTGGYGVAEVAVPPGGRRRQVNRHG